MRARDGTKRDVSSYPGDDRLLFTVQPLREVVVVYHKTDKTFGYCHQDRVYDSFPNDWALEHICDWDREADGSLSMKSLARGNGAVTALNSARVFYYHTSDGDQ